VGGKASSAIVFDYIEVKREFDGYLVVVAISSETSEVLVTVPGCGLNEIAHQICGQSGLGITAYASCGPGWPGMSWGAIKVMGALGAGLRDVFSRSSRGVIVDLGEMGSYVRCKAEPSRDPSICVDFGDRDAYCDELAREDLKAALEAFAREAGLTMTFEVLQSRDASCTGSVCARALGLVIGELIRAA